ncbi:GlsB/YeaQ/YmgE family stress response membrane protein [Chloroflexota bacterium]
MDIVLMLVAMVIVGLVAGWLAGLIWKTNRPIGVSGDYIVAVISAVVIGLIDWLVIPAMGFSDTVKYLGIATEPLLGALLVLWIIRKAKG